MTLQGRNGEVAAAHEAGIVTVTSAADAARVRAERVAAAPLMRRSQRNAEREKRGEADHSLAGLLLYALSTVRGQGINCRYEPKAQHKRRSTKEICSGLLLCCPASLRAVCNAGASCMV